MGQDGSQQNKQSQAEEGYEADPSGRGKIRPVSSDGYKAHDVVGEAEMVEYVCPDCGITASYYQEVHTAIDCWKCGAHMEKKKKEP